MKHAHLYQEEASEARALTVWVGSRTKSGIEFDPNAHIWAYRDGVNNIHLDFDQLPTASPVLRNGAKSVLTWYAENRSPDHLKNMFQRLQHFLRSTPMQVSSITAVDLLNYRAGLHQSKEWYLGSFAGFLRKWVQLGYPGSMKTSSCFSNNCGSRAMTRVCLSLHGIHMMVLSPMSKKRPCNQRSIKHMRKVMCLPRTSPWRGFYPIGSAQQAVRVPKGLRCQGGNRC